MMSTLALLLLTAMGGIVVTTARQTWQECVDSIVRSGRPPPSMENYDVHKEILGSRWFLKAVSFELFPKNSYFAFVKPHQPSEGVVQQIVSRVDFRNGNYKCIATKVNRKCNGPLCTGYLANGTVFFTSHVLAMDYISTYIYYGTIGGITSINMFVTDPSKKLNETLLDKVSFNVCGGNNAPLASSIKILDVPEAVVLAHEPCFHEAA